MGKVETFGEDEFFVKGNNNLKNTNSHKEDVILAITLCLIIFRISISSFLVLLGSFITSDGLYALLTYYFILFAFLLVAVFLSFRKIKKDIVVVLLVVVIVSLVTMIFFPENIKHIFQMSSGLLLMPFIIFIVFSLPCYILIRQIYNLKLFTNVLKYFSYMILAISFILFFAKSYLGNIDYSYMTFSYELLTPTCLFFNEYFKGKSIRSLIMAISSFILILVGGARGTILCVLAYLIFAYIMNFSKQRKRSLLLGVSASAVIGIIWANFANIVRALRLLIISYGIDSRTLYYLDVNIASDSSGRNIIIEAVKQAIWNHPIIGMGLYGDRVATENLGILSGSYAHNIFYEILCQFGIILGGILLIGIIIVIILPLVMKTDNIAKNIILIMIPSGLIKLFISNSYLQEPYFFLLIGICVTCIIQRKKIWR